MFFLKKTYSETIIRKRFYEKFRSSRPEVFCKKGVLRNCTKFAGKHLYQSLKKGVLGNFAKFTGKHLCQSLFFNKVAGRPATLLSKRLWHMCFPVNFA